MNDEKEIRIWIHSINSEKKLTRDFAILMMNNIANLSAFETGKHIELIAHLYCNILRKLSDDVNDELCVAVSRAFESIQRMDTEKEHQNCADIKVIQFLKKIYYKNLENKTDNILSGEEIRNDFHELVENLDRISVIFKMQINGTIIFQIRSLLKDIITKWNPNQFKLTIDQINIIFLAIQIFQFQCDKSLDELLDKIVQKYNLKFLNYMRQSNIGLLGGTENWRKNYLQNEVLVIADITNHKILIRSEDKEYIEKNYCYETNANNQKIAFFEEINYDDGFMFCDAEDILKSGNPIQIVALLKIMLSGYTNIFLENSLIRKGDEIRVVNKYSDKDKYFIKKDGKIVKNTGFDRIIECLEPYSLQVLGGNSIDCLTLGLFMSLQKIERISFDYLITKEVFDEKNVQNKVIINWLTNCKTPLKSWYKWKEVYYNELQYVKQKKDYQEQNFKGLHFYPIQLEHEKIEKCLLKALFEELYLNGELCFATVKHDYEKGTIFEIVQGKEQKRLEKISWMDEIFKKYEFNEGEKVAFWYDGLSTYYIGTELKRLIDTLEESKKNNERLLPIQILAYTVEDDINVIQKYMYLHKEGLEETCGVECDFDSMARFRIANQLCFFQITEPNKYDAYIKLIKRHSKLGYEFLKSEQGKFFNKATLYVPKERGDRFGTLYYINELILKSNAKRQKEHLYYTTVDYENDGTFSFLGERINKIVFLFDTLQSGAATIRSLSCYFEHKKDEKWVEVNKEYINYAQKYYDINGKEIFIEDIIQKNNIDKKDIEVRCFYGTEQGVQRVKSYCDQKGIGHDCLNGIEVIKNQTIPVDSKVSKEDYNMIIKLFKEPGNIFEGSYMIVRRYNAAKQNIFPKEALNPENIVSIFIKKDEIEHKE